jgi:hypothetical protein
MSTNHPSLFPPDGHFTSSSTSTWQVIASAASIGVMLSLCAAALHSRTLGGKERPLRLLLNYLPGVLAGVLAVKLIHGSIQNRDGIRERLEMVAEMNHHIRNALQVIELSAHSTRNEQAIASITQAVNRIERVLREIVGAERRKTPRPDGLQDTSGSQRVAS